jgi:hypothetical protein
VDLVERAETEALFVRSPDGPLGAGAAFGRLESALGGPKGRRFLGWFHRGEYRACVVRKPEDDPVALGLEEGRLAGGRYARRRHVGPLERIHETFRALLAVHAEDPDRPSLEEYRRHDEVYALLPIREALDGGQDRDGTKGRGSEARRSQ